MTEKVVLPKEVAEQLVDLRKHHISNATILSSSYNGEFDGSIYADLGDYVCGPNFDNFLAALVNGYEVEKSPEDKLREYYEWAEKSRQKFADSEDFTRADARLDGLLSALDILGIKVEGINAK